ncbi:MAG: NAD(P)H-hydrate dehydratase [Phyllobacterium sp.]
MVCEILTPQEMSEADRLTIAAGQFDGQALMRRAGYAVASHLLAHYGDASLFHVLCGPGNNGGDGHVVAHVLAQSGAAVHVWACGKPGPDSDAAHARRDSSVRERPIDGFAPSPGDVVVDALFGAGLNRPVAGAAASAIERANGADVRRIAVDVPSGLDGLTGQALGTVFEADCTISFFRKKPGHLLYPGRQLCGALVIADIGIDPDVLGRLQPRCFENAPELWRDRLPCPGADTHKYRRGHAAIFSGGATSTGAARLSAMAAARSGAGAVTLLSPEEALAINAAHLTSIMLHRCDHARDVHSFLQDRSPGAFVLGPGFGIGGKTREIALALLQAEQSGLVLDADAISSFRDDPEILFAASRKRSETGLVLTPHEGEFKRLFPDLAEAGIPSKLERARAAASRANAIVIYKGADTVVASPEGRAAINSNGTPLLATAGSGDVLAGLTAGLLAQGMPAFEAACAAVFIHAAAARECGFGLIAEDLPAAAARAIAALVKRPG